MICDLIAPAHPLFLPDAYLTPRFLPQMQHRAAFHQLEHPDLTLDPARVRALPLLEYP